MTMKRFFKAFIFTFIMAAAFVTVKPSVSAQAASGSFVRLSLSEVTKVGKYYFKYSEGLYCGKSAGTIKKQVCEKGSDAVTNGKIVYYVKYGDDSARALVKYTISTGKTTVVMDNLPTGNRTHEDDSWSVSAVYGKNIYMTRYSFEKSIFWTYTYNTSTKKLKCIASKANIAAVSGNYALVEHTFRTDATPTKLSLYKLTAKGMTKVKALGKYCESATLYKGKFYYVKYTDKSMMTARLYRMNVNGKSLKVIKKFSAEGDNPVTIVSNITDKNCIVTMNDVEYTYVYSSKELNPVAY